MNAATLRLLAEKGLSIEDIIEVAESLERKSDPTAAERQSRYRQRRDLSDQDWYALVGAVIQRDGWVCSYCDCDTSIHGHAIDHVIPLAKGGTNELDNLTMSCKSCNSSKGARILGEEWTPPNDDFLRWQREGESN